MKLAFTLASFAMAGSAALTQGPGSAEADATWMVVEHEVADFDHWHRIFETALPTRRSVGELSHRIHRDPADPNRLTVVMKWDTDARARSFARDPILASGMRAAGVTDGVRIWICSAATAPASAGASADCEFVAGQTASAGTAAVARMP